MHLMQGDVLTRDDLYKRGPKVHAKMELRVIFSGDFKSHNRSVHQKHWPWAYTVRFPGFVFSLRS